MNKLTVIQLKDILRGYGLKVSGRKQELIDRITAHEENDYPNLDCEPWDGKPIPMLKKTEIKLRDTWERDGITYEIHEGSVRIKPLNEKFTLNVENLIIRRKAKSCKRSHFNTYDLIYSYHPCARWIESEPIVVISYNKKNKLLNYVQPYFRKTDKGKIEMTQYLEHTCKCHDNDNFGQGYSPKLCKCEFEMIKKRINSFVPMETLELQVKQMVMVEPEYWYRVGKHSVLPFENKLLLENFCEFRQN